MIVAKPSNMTFFERLYPRVDELLERFGRPDFQDSAVASLRRCQLILCSRERLTGDAMSNLTMIIYSEYDGVESTVVWRNEEQFQQVKKFLQGLGLHVSGATSEGERTRATFVYMKNRATVQSHV